MSRTRRASTRLISLVIAVSMTGAALTIGGPTQAAGDKTVLYIDAEPHSVGMSPDNLGKSFAIFGTEAERVIGQHGGAGWEFEDSRVIFDAPAVGGAAGNGYWWVHLGSPHGTRLVPGTYTGATRAPFRTGSEPGIDVTGNGSGCNTLTGEFTLHEIEWEVGVLHSLSASFRQRCDGAAGAPAPGDTYGEIRFNATTGVKALEARPWSVDFGSADSGTSAGVQDVTVKSIGDRIVNLGTASIAGDASSSFAITANTCTGSTLDPGQSCVIRVSATPSTNKVLDAKLRLVDDTYRGNREVPLQVEGIGTVNATADVSAYKFYPVVDQYQDTLAVKGSRPTAARVDIEITPDGSSDVVATGTVPMGTGDYMWVWRGKDDATGELAPAGKYVIVTTLSDASPNLKTVTKRITLSHDYVTWKKKTSVKEGRKISLWGWSKDGKISFSKSIYASGVLINSGRGFAAVVYTLPVAKSNIYGWMSYEVEGKSANRRKAMVAAWNPRLGGPKDLSHYDAARKIGPWKKWWKTGGQGQGRAKDGKVRLAVMVWKGLGGSGKSVFDIKRVRVVYEVGTMHRASGLATAFPDEPARTVGPRVARVAPSRLPSLRKAPTHLIPPVLPEGPALPIEEREPAADTEPGPGAGLEFEAMEVSPEPDEDPGADS